MKWKAVIGVVTDAFGVRVNAHVRPIAYLEVLDGRDLDEGAPDDDQEAGYVIGLISGCRTMSAHRQWTRVGRIKESG